MGKKEVMLGALLIIIGVFSNYAQAGGPVACLKQAANESLIERADFPWDQSLEEISNLEQVVYESGKRLPERAYITENKVILSIKEEKAMSWGLNFHEISMDLGFVENLKAHFFKMNEAKYGEHLIYSDLGHGHVFMSKEDSQKLDELGVSSDDADYYEFVFKSKKTKVLYHTVEQLHAPQNQAEEWRKENRTILGDAEGNIEVIPFAKSLDGYSQVFSLYFNASKDGCFSLEDKNFDISLSSPK